MNFLVQHMINSGVPQETIILLLMLPMLSTIIAFSRQIIGLKGFGIYTPLLISFAFLATGLKYGLLFFTLIIIIATIFRFAMKRFRLLYLPRIAIILIGLTIVIFVIFLESSYSNRNEIINISVFAILIMVVLAEKFIVAQTERGFKNAIILTIETLILSAICYFVINFIWLENAILNHPFTFILLTLLINIFLGKWTGLRLSEYFRFREVIKRIELPKEKP